MPLTPQDFVSKWKRSTGRENQTYQQHFLDLCELDGVVFAAYGWTRYLSDEEILEKLLAMNLERSKQELEI
jgi:hypothetical protein